MIPKLKFFVSSPPTRASTLYHGLSGIIAGRSRDLARSLDRLYFGDGCDPALSLEDNLIAFARANGLAMPDERCPLCKGARHVYSVEMINEYREQNICEPCPLCNVWPNYGAKVLVDVDVQDLPL